MPRSASPPSPPRSLRLLSALRLRVILLSWAVPLGCLTLWLPWRVWILELARHFYLYGLSLLVILTVLCAVLRLWKTAALPFTVMLLMAWPLRDYYALSASPPPAAAVPGVSGNSFSLLSCNLLYRVQEPERMRAALSQANPDVLFLMEFTPEWRTLLQPVLAGYPHQTGRAEEGYSGIWLASRLPLENPRITDATDGDDPVLTVRLRLPSRTVDFTGAHPMIPVKPEQFAKAQSQFAVYQNLLRGNDSGDAQVMAGDLNCTPFALTFRDFLRSTGLRDSAGGHGLTATWFPSVLPWQLFGLPIDHVLISPKIKVLERSTGPQTGSDHRWVQVRLAVE